MAAMKTTTDAVQTVQAADGIPLVYETVASADPKALLLHVHGLGINRKYVLPLAAQLAEKGITTCAMDVRGHGESGGDRGYIEDYRLFLSDVRHVVEDIRSGQPDLPLFLSGLSLGGQIALATAMAYPKMLRGVIALSPVLVDSYLPLSLKAVMIGKMAAGSLFGELHRHRYPTALGLGIKVSSNPAGNELMANDSQRQNEVTVKLYWEILLMNIFLGRHPQLLTTSLLLLLAGDDRVGQNWAMRSFFRSLTLADKTLVEYPDLCHDLALEYHEPQIAQDMAKWIGCRI